MAIFFPYNKKISFWKAQNIDVWSFGIKQMLWVQFSWYLFQIKPHIFKNLFCVIGIKVNKEAIEYLY